MPENTTNWSKAFQMACVRLGGVPWAEPEFLKHAQQVAPDGCPHPEDVYVAGAAGNRIGAAWKFINRDLRQHAIGILRKYSTPGHEPEDLWSTSVMKLMDETDGYPLSSAERKSHRHKPAKIILFAGKTSLLNYFITVAKRFASDQRKKKAPAYLDLTAVSLANATGHAESPNESVDLRKLREQLNGIMSSWSGEEIFLFQAVHVEGRTRIAAAKILGWNDATRATRRLQKLCAQINDAVDWDAGSGTDHGETSQLRDIVKEICRLVQFRDSESSEPNRKDGNEPPSPNQLGP